MQKRYGKSGIGWLTGLMLPVILAGMALAQPSEGPQLPSHSIHTTALTSEEESSSPQGEWWLGVQCRPVTETLRKQLDLGETEGILVERIVPKSPAEKAGLQRHDILLTARGKPLHSPRDLMEAVNATEGKELDVEYLRDGQKHQVALKPQHRPEWARMSPPGPMSAEQSELLRKWLEQFQSGEPGVPLRFRFLHPATILPPDAPTHPPLPPDVSITIVKQGSELARVTVTRGGEKWEVAENQLDKLPKELIPYAESMLGRSLWGPKDAVRFFEFIPDWNDRPQAGKAAREPSSSQSHKGDTTPNGDTSDSLQERLEMMKRQLEQLQRSIEELQKERPH